MAYQTLDQQRYNAVVSIVLATKTTHPDGLNFYEIEARLAQAGQLSRLFGVRKPEIYIRKACREGHRRGVLRQVQTRSRVKAFRAEGAR